MFYKNVILKEINKLQKMYDATLDPEEKQLLGKIALVELCGWIEFSIEDLARNSVQRSGCSLSHINFIKERIDKNHSISYMRHFKPLICICIGIIEFEDIEIEVEKKIGTKALIQFQASLDSLKQLRDSIAHCHVHGAVKKASSPNTLIKQLDEVFAGLKAYRVEIRESLG